MFLRASGLFGSLSSMRVCLSRLHEDFDVFASVINAVPG